MENIAMIKILFSLLCTLYPIAILAEDISAAYGYSLGMQMSNVKVLSTITSDSGNKLHVVKPMDAGNTETVLLGVSKDDKQVASITARSSPMSMSDCASQLALTVDRLKRRYPGSGYYALDDADMIYQKDRSIIVGCQVAGEEVSLVVEYRDDLLSK